jgi:hypothetical protein
MPSTKNVCAACGFDQLRAPQRSRSGGASHEICPSCGFESGYTDDDQGITPQDWGKQWIAAGSKWFSKGIPQPKARTATKKKPTKKAAKKTPTKSAKKSAKRRKT